MPDLKNPPLSGGIRFAPSPTGRFHLGNLRTAWISEAWARAVGRPWTVRFEDIDTDRVVKGAQETQLTDMQSLGLVPDEIVIQSDHHLLHFSWFHKAILAGAVYPCDCSRKDVQLALEESISAPHGLLPVYSGKCRDRDLAVEPLSAISPTWAWRFRNEGANGEHDFIIARSKAGEEPHPDAFTPAYHWACALDDHFGGYSLLVRAWDLAASAPLQRAIQRWLCEYEKTETIFPPVFHTSLVVQDSGARLEKRTRGVTLNELKALGYAPDRIKNWFETSFERSLLRTPLSNGALFGEAKREISFSELTRA